MKIRALIFILSIVTTSYAEIIPARDRAEELKDEMWNSSDKDFKVVSIPEKWKGKSAVIIAQLHRFEYRKAVMASELRVNEYSHFRIKLLDQNAITKYAELYYSASEPMSLMVYPGFKVIKPNGKEIVVDLANAVRMQREGANGKFAYLKMAIPNLEPGDIIDYYICEEKILPRTALIQFFEPVIYNLPQEYPVIKQKLQFQLQRKCYINLRSLNGAPELKLVVDEKNDEKYYSLEDGDRDGVKDVRWLYPNRELPTIKFRAAYAQNAMIAGQGVLLGEQGEVKSSVTGDEIVKLTNALLSTPYYTKDASKYIKEKYKAVKDPVEISKAAYYYYRNQMLEGDEISALNGEGLASFSEVRFLQMFSSFLSSKKIYHEIVVSVSKNISAFDDIVIENELEYFLRVPKGKEYVYFYPLNIYLTPGQISPRLEGADAYVIDGLASAYSRKAKKITLPISKPSDNISESTVTITTADMTSAAVSVKHALKGYNKLFTQYEVLDVYDAIDEDDKKFKKLESFSSQGSSLKKKYTAMKTDYLSARDKKRNENLKKSIESEYAFKIKDASNFKVHQTGRYEDKSELIYSFDFTTEELFKKTGPNYLIDLGKLIEQQVKIEGDELARNHNVYFDHNRSFKYTIIMDVPKGYEVQGLDNFRQKVENKTGGFTSTARLENGKLIIETHKHYDNIFVPKDQWPQVVAFLNAASTFGDQKVLLKKVSK